jgi:hypothetical protein
MHQAMPELRGKPVGVIRFERPWRIPRFLASRTPRTFWQRAALASFEQAMTRPSKDKEFWSAARRIPDIERLPNRQVHGVGLMALPTRN